MSLIPVQRVRVKTRELVEATLHLDLHPNKLMDTEAE